MSEFSSDLFTEPSPADINTLNNLGPLAPMAGIWKGERNLVHKVGEPLPNPLASGVPA